MSDYVDQNGSPKSVTIRGVAAETYILWDQIMSGSVSLSTSQLTQMTLSFREFADRWPVLASGVLTPSNGLEKSNYGSASADIGPLKLQIGTLSVAPLGASAKVTIEARSLGGQRMKVNTDPSTLSNVSYTQWVRAKVESLGMTFVGEGTPVVAQVGNSNGQDSWTTIQKLAGDVGFIAFEAAGTFYFARPSWILARGKPVVADFSQAQNPNDALLELPACQRDADSGKTTIRARFRPGFDHMLPGDELIVKNVPSFNGSYIITGVDLDMSPDGVISVSAETPVDPTPKGLPTQPSALANASAATSTTVRTPAAGSYGGEKLTSAQVDIARRIIKVCQDRGLNPRAGLLSVMCAYQESRLRELTGGDRDSVGPFQQRPSQGWGTAAQCRNTEYATGKFLDVLVKEKDWRTGTPTTVIANVQRPKKEYRNLYAQWQPMAQALVDASLVTSVVPTTSATNTGGGTSQVERFVQLCLKQAGDTYRFGAEVRLNDPDPNTFDCSELVEWACYQVGVKISDGSQNQRAACKRFKQLTIAQAMKTRGALVFTSGHVAVSLGDGRTIEAKGRKYGVVVDVVGKRFTDAGLIPNLSGYVVG